MSKLLWSLVGLALIGSPMRAADEKKTDEKKVEEKKQDTPRRPGARNLQAQPAQPRQPFGRNQALLSEKEMEDLKLSGEQKDKAGKIVKDFEEKAKEYQEELRKAFQGGQFDREKMQKLRETQTKARTEAESKITELLNADQKKKFEEIKQARRTQPGRGPGAFGTPFKLGQVIPENTKGRLELTDDQKKQIEAIEKEVKAKLEKVLNADQLKKLEQPQGRGTRPGAGGDTPRRRPGADNTQPRRPRADQ